MHSTESENNVLPFKEFSSSLSRYSDNNQLQARQYKGIIESQLGESIYQREFPSQGDEASNSFKYYKCKYSKKIYKN